MSSAKRRSAGRVGGRLRSERPSMATSSSCCSCAASLSSTPRSSSPALVSTIEPVRAARSIGQRTCDDEIGEPLSFARASTQSSSTWPTFTHLHETAQLSDVLQIVPKRLEQTLA